MNIPGLIASFATGQYTVTRTAARSVVNGRAVAGATSTFQITASVSPISGRELQRVPEGRRATSNILIITDTMLMTGGVGASYEADRVSVNGMTWEVSRVQQWMDPVSGSTGYACTAQNYA